MSFRPGFMRNWQKNHKIIEKISARRDSVMTIMFDNLGTDPYLKSVDVKDSFTVNEQTLLMEAMIATVRCSERVQEAGKSKFNDHHDLLEHWFGLKPAQSDF
ncbi:MAG: hypothetical protein KAH18_09170 [Psychromonas sp.]|nr:hypothetical protein [Psychromonas sp.]